MTKRVFQQFTRTQIISRCKQTMTYSVMPLMKWSEGGKHSLKDRWATRGKRTKPCSLNIRQYEKLHRFFWIALLRFKHFSGFTSLMKNSASYKTDHGEASVKTSRGLIAPKKIPKGIIGIVDSRVAGHIAYA